MIRSPKYLAAAKGQELARVKMLAAVERLPNSRYHCICDCGKERIVSVGHFNSGTVKSCGCTRFVKDIGAHGPCIVDGCENERCNSRGWCWTHYTRWRRHGDPLQTEYGKPQSWLEDHAHYSGQDCLIWPFGGRDNGYGTLVYDGEHVSAHRKMCELRYGPPPTPEHEAAHFCGNGAIGCVNPNHVRWATPNENQADKLIHGTHNRGERCSSAVLTTEIVRAVRLEYRPRTVTYKMLAAKYGVSESAVKGAVSGRTWGWLQ